LAVDSAETLTGPRNMRSLSTWCARHTSKLIVHQQKLAAQKRIYSLKIELQGDVLGRGYQESWLARMETRAWHRGARVIALGGNDRDFRPSRARAFHSGPELRGTHGPRALGRSGSGARLSWERARAFAPRPCRHRPPCRVAPLGHLTCVAKCAVTSGRMSVVVADGVSRRSSADTSGNPGD
jgi:hypothetical protein